MHNAQQAYASAERVSARCIRTRAHSSNTRLAQHARVGGAAQEREHGVRDWRRAILARRRGGGGGPRRVARGEGRRRAGKPERQHAALSARSGGHHAVQRRGAAKQRQAPLPRRHVHGRQREGEEAQRAAVRRLPRVAQVCPRQRAASAREATREQASKRRRARTEDDGQRARGDGGGGVEVHGEAAAEAFVQLHLQRVLFRSNDASAR